MNAQTINKELGTDAELAELVARIQGFDHANATTNENLALSRALKVLAADIVQRHTRVREMQEELHRKLQLAEVTSEMSEVLKSLKPKRRWRIW